MIILSEYLYSLLDHFSLPLGLQVSTAPFTFDLLPFNATLYSLIPPLVSIWEILSSCDFPGGTPPLSEWIGL